MIIEKIEVDSPEAQPYVIPEFEKMPKHYIRVERAITHNCNTISSTKRVNYVTTFKNFLTYSGKEHALHLKVELKYKSKVNTDLEGQFYIGITLKWEYEKGTVQLSMTGYLCAALHSFQHEKPKRPQDL